MMDGKRSVTLGRILTHHAAVRSRQLAVAGGRVLLDFATLNKRANRLANALLGKVGLCAGDRVVLRLPNSPRHFECLFACAKSATVFVPVDANAPAHDIARVVRDTAPALVLDSEELYDSLFVEVSDSEPAVPVADTDPLLIMRTSGTTGHPKGAVLTHANVIYTCFNQIIDWRLTALDRALIVAGLHHVGGLLALGLASLYAGGSLHIVQPILDRILESIERDRITGLFLPPRLWNRLAFTETINSADLTSVRLCASGGDQIPSAILKRLMDRFQAEFTDAYGLTEASSCSTLLHGCEFSRRPGSAGRAMAHNVIQILNPDGTQAAPGEIGEIVQSGPTVMQGYWKRPEETAVAIRNGMLWTGDHGFMDHEGFLFVLGRRSDVLASGDITFYPSEIERALREHPSIEDAAVVCPPESSPGEALTAWVVPRPNGRVTAEKMMAYCIAKLPAGKRPNKILLRSDLPRNSNGKVIKAKLREECYGITQVGDC